MFSVEPDHRELIDFINSMVLNVSERIRNKWYNISEVTKELTLQASEIILEKHIALCDWEEIKLNINCAAILLQLCNYTVCFNPM